jgi:DNA repair protein RecN (Recombination protein N)
MLLELTIQNLAIIRDLRVCFGPGLNALTGETGAGKSIIIDALGAVLGARASAELVRTGARNASVEAVFDITGSLERAGLRTLLDEAGIEPEDGLLILARDISASGRSIARINGRAVPASTLARIGEQLVDIHGQSDHLSLLHPARHLELLDRFAGTVPEREALSSLVREYHAVRSQIDQIGRDERERARRIDLLRFQVDEIRASQLRPDEDRELDQERTILTNAERLAGLAAEAYQLLEGGDELGAEPSPGALDNLRLAAERIDELARFDPSIQDLAGQIREAQYLLEDYTQTIRGYGDAIEADPARLAQIEDRLALIKQLKRKYGSTVEEITSYGEQAAAELDELDSSEHRLEELHERAGGLKREIGERGLSLSNTRHAAAERLSRAVEHAIAELNMGRSTFTVDFRELAGHDGVPVTINGSQRLVPFDTTGIDRVEFLIAPNAGEMPKPLARIASGGEMARLMLALKSILSAADATPTLIFDEVDVGVGGRSGQVVGEKLWSLGDRHQVIVISHLPQIAAFGEAHYRITKRERDGRTETAVDQLDGETRIDELAAMLDGLPVTGASRENAREMLARIARWKQEMAGAIRRAG